MTVQIYVPFENDVEIPPRHNHESRPALEFVSRLWEKFNAETTFYAIVMNCSRPSVDFVIMSARGIGILEWKDKKGTLEIHPNNWILQVGTARQSLAQGDHKTPHDQVKSYAQRILQEIRQGSTPPWQAIPTDALSKYFLYTAVCFTSANIQLAQDQLHSATKTDRENIWKIEPWERFELLRPAEIDLWAARVCVEAQAGPPDYPAYLLTVEQINDIATRILKTRPSVEIPKFMPDGNPYGRLIVKNGEIGGTTIYLNRQSFALGRHRTPGFPDSYSDISHDHINLTRTFGTVYITDMGSDFGTYVNNVRLPPNEPFELHDNAEILLGGAVSSPVVARVVYLASGGQIDPTGKGRAPQDPTA